MVASIRCLVLTRGTKSNCEKLCKELCAKKEYIKKNANHHEMVCTTYFPCDMLLDFTFEELASKFSVDIAYIFGEDDDQLCEYNLDYNLENFLSDNELSEIGTICGFEEKTGATDDTKILQEFLNESQKKQENEGPLGADDRWCVAFEAVAEYDDKLVKKGKFSDQVSVSGLAAADAGFPRVRLAAEAGDEHARLLIKNLDKAFAEME